jgi:hypothetical protein
MREPTPPRNRDQDLPTKSGEEIGEHEPLTPKPGPEKGERNAPLPEEETYERDRNETRSDDKPPVED